MDLDSRQFFRAVPSAVSLRPRWLPAFVSLLLLGGCSTSALLPSSGPSRSEISESARIDLPGKTPVQIVPMTESIARALLLQRGFPMLSDTLTEAPRLETETIGIGDTVEISIWEAPPATLFASGSPADPRAGAAVGTSRAVSFPEQIVGRDGTINIPFAGSFSVAGMSRPEVEKEVARRLQGKANQPQVLARLIRNQSASVTVIGDVGASTRLPLGPSSERLLDALAAAGGAKFPVNKTTLQITRGTSVAALPLDAIIRDPRQNVRLQAGDIVTALHEPLSFTVMGATGKNDEVKFEAQGISLAQAMARSGGLQDNRADAQGIFIFRYENPKALDWPRKPVGVTAAGTVPVIYTINLKDPASFFVMQTFAVQNKDVLYVANAPLAEIQKFANVIYSIAFPVVNTINATR